MDILSTIVLTTNMIVNQFCSDFDIKKCNMDIRLQSSKTLPWVRDPKGVRRAHGQCVDNRILLNKKHWYSINNWEKKELLYHELGHCYFGLGHNNKISIMNPFPKATYYHVKEDGSNWKSLVEELKKEVK